MQPTRRALSRRQQQVLGLLRPRHLLPAGRRGGILRVSFTLDFTFRPSAIVITDTPPLFAFSHLTMLVGRQQEFPACKN